MLKVLPIQTKSEQEEICKKCNVEFKPDLLAYSATVDGELRGVSQFKLTEKGGLVYDIAPAIDTYDFEALFVLGRGTLNFIDLCGVHYATFDAPIADEAEERLVRAIGFSLGEDGRWGVDLTHFFEHPCQHHATGPADQPNF
jgi:hypothetical protein